jgi:hypothetical protein
MRLRRSGLVEAAELRSAGAVGVFTWGTQTTINPASAPLNPSARPSASSVAAARDANLAAAAIPAAPAVNAGGHTGAAAETTLASPLPAAAPGWVAPAQQKPHNARSKPFDLGVEIGVLPDLADAAPAARRRARTDIVPDDLLGGGSPARSTPLTLHPDQFPAE